MKMYRQTSLGIALKETLEEKNIEEETQAKIWEQFDKIFEGQMKEHSIKGSLQGKLQLYQNIECQQEQYNPDNNEGNRLTIQKKMRLSLVVKDPKIYLDPSQQQIIPLDNPLIKIYAIGEQYKPGKQKPNQKHKRQPQDKQGRKKKF